MKLRLSGFVMVLIVGSVVWIEPILVSKFITHGESTPKFTNDPLYNTTHVDYGLESGQLTPIGVKKMWQLGVNTRAEYSDKKNLLPDYYEHKNIFVRGMLDNPTVLSAYAFVIGMYPQTVEGIRFMNNFKQEEEEVDLDDINSIRKILNIKNMECGDQMLNYYGGNRDLEFLTRPINTYKGLSETINSNMNIAKIVFEREYSDQFYKALAKTIGVDPHFVTFSSAILYLDDYVTAKFNGKQIPYEFDQNTKNMIQRYYTQYYRDGLFKDPAINRVFTHSYFKNLAKEMLLKYENDQEYAYTSFQNEFIDFLGLSVHFGNHQTFLAIMHQMFEIEEYFPSFSEEITWTLFYSAGEYKVKGEYDGKPLKLEGKADIDGYIPIERFLNYLWTKIYYGSINNVISGRENPKDHLNIPNGSCLEYLGYEDTITEQILDRKPEDFDDAKSSWTLDSYSNPANLARHAQSFPKKSTKSEESGDVVYVVTHPVVYVDSYPQEIIPEARPTYQNRPNSIQNSMFLN